MKHVVPRPELSSECWSVFLFPVKKERKITLSFTSPEKEKYFFNIYDVIASPEKENRSSIQY